MTQEQARLVSVVSTLALTTVLIACLIGDELRKRRQEHRFATLLAVRDQVDMAMTSAARRTENAAQS